MESTGTKKTGPIQGMRENGKNRREFRKQKQILSKFFREIAKALSQRELNQATHASISHPPPLGNFEVALFGSIPTRNASEG
jgi:hypothetical protein